MYPENPVLNEENERCVAPLPCLNEAQKEAVMTTEGYIRVIAGAGSGKTRALAHRFAYLVKDLGVPASSILCVTFTHKAAKEMSLRIRKLIGDRAMGYISTYHSFCVKVLQEDIHTINYPKNFMVLDEEDTTTLIQNVYAERNLSLRDKTIKNAKKDIAQLKTRNPSYINDLISLDKQALKSKYDKALSLDDIIFWGYLYEQKKCFAFDYNDLILCVLHIFDTFENILQKWQKRLEYVMVDEFQDIDAHQYVLIELLSNHHKNLFIVGDPDQTIYTWRGSDINRIVNFDKRFPEVKTIVLDRNYRSSPNILDVANSLIEKNKNRIPKYLLSVLDNNEPVLYKHCLTQKAESDWMVEQIKKLQIMGVSLNSIAILYRAHYVSRSVEEAFISNNLKYILYSGVNFYNRKEIKDILAYLKLIVFQDDLSFERIINCPKRNIGKRKLEFLKSYAQSNDCSLYHALSSVINDNVFKGTQATEFVDLIEKFRNSYTQMSLSDLLSDLVNQSGYEELLRLNGEQERLDNLAELKQSIFEYESTIGEDFTLEDYLQQIALLTSVDKNNNTDAIKMMTIHTAKGLEFPFVFVCGFSEGIFPSKNIKTLEELEEERRLAYVAITRAEKMLFLSDSEGINFDHSFRYPSRFIFNVKKELLSFEEELRTDLIQATENYITLNEQTLSAGKNNLKFNIGNLITHPAFGRGKIEDINMETFCYVLSFEQFDTLRNMKIDILEKIATILEDS